MKIQWCCVAFPDAPFTVCSCSLPPSRQYQAPHTHSSWPRQTRTTLRVRKKRVGNHQLPYTTTRFPYHPIPEPAQPHPKQLQASILPSHDRSERINHACSPRRRNPFPLPPTSQSSIGTTMYSNPKPHLPPPFETQPPAPAILSKQHYALHKLKLNQTLLDSRLRRLLRLLVPHIPRPLCRPLPLAPVLWLLRDGGLPVLRRLPLWMLRLSMRNLLR